MEAASAEIICKGCGKDLLELNQHNRDVHTKACTRKRKKTKEADDNLKKSKSFLLNYLTAIPTPALTTKKGIEIEGEMN